MRIVIIRMNTDHYRALLGSRDLKESSVRRRNSFALAGRKCGKRMFESISRDVQKPNQATWRISTAPRWRNTIREGSSHQKSRASRSKKSGERAQRAQTGIEIWLIFNSANRKNKKCPSPQKNGSRNATCAEITCKPDNKPLLSNAVISFTINV